PTCADAEALLSITDNCATPVVTCQAGLVIPGSSSCELTQSFVVTATDDCGNSAECTVTFTWTQDIINPVISGCPAGSISLGCNPSELPDCDDAKALLTAADNCSDPILTCQAGTIIEDGCQRSLTFTV